ncbi:Putative nucleobase-ascorbate transporter 10 [Linum perenne]
MAQGNSGGNGNGKKPEESLQPHPVKEQLPGVQYCINSPPPWPEAMVLGFQHYLLTLGMTVLIPSIIVPQMGGGNVISLEKVRVIQTLLFVSGVTTLLETVLGTRLPSVAAASFAYVLPITSIVTADRFQSIADPHERFVLTMRAIQGSLILTGCFQVVMGFLGIWRNAVRLLSPLSIAPCVTFAGLGLYYLGFPAYLPHYVKTKRPLCDRFGLLFSVPIVWLYSQLLTSSGVYEGKSVVTQLSCRTDRSGLVTAAPWVFVPYPFQWGSPTFKAGETFAMMAASFVSLFEVKGLGKKNLMFPTFKLRKAEHFFLHALSSMQSTGTFYATARYGSATPVPPSIVSRGIGWLGVGVLLNGVFGSVTGFTASVENAGLLALTKVGSRRVIQISAAFMIFFSVFGKFGAFLASIPLPIIAGIYCILFCYVSSAGLGCLQFCNLNSFRTKFILGFSFFMGISIPQYFREYYLQLDSTNHSGSRWFRDIVSTIFMSHAVVATLVALLLDSTMSGEAEEVKRDNGRKWFEKFSLYSSDIRSDEFYGLPCCFNKLFPSH